MGRKTYLMRRLHTLWKIQGDLGLVDLGNNIFPDEFSIPMTCMGFALFRVYGWWQIIILP